MNLHDSRRELMLLRSDSSMRLDRADEVAGLSAPAAREAMRLLREPRPVSVLDRFTDGISRPHDIAQAFADAGYLSLYMTDPDGESWWVTTTAGNALAQASFRKPITRRTADRQLVMLVDRAREYNENDAYLLHVTELRVFGSYLDSSIERLSDLDIAVSYTRRPFLAGADLETFTDLVLSYARGSSRTFKSLFDELQWPEVELLRILRGGAASVSLVTEDITELTDRWKSVFRKS